MGQCKKTDCPLYGKTEVPYSGNKKAEVVIIGESPGYNEEIEGEPFCGDSGDLMTVCCAAAGLNWQDCMIANSARCRIIVDQMTNSQITQTLKCCRGYIETLLFALKPKIIVCLGNIAIRQILHRSKITKVRGAWVWSSEFNAWVMPAYHPAYILRKRALQPILVSDLKEVKAFQDRGYKQSDSKLKLDYKEVDSIRPLLDAGLPIAWDTECQGLDWTQDPYIVIGASLCNQAGKAVWLQLYEEVKSKAKSDLSIVWPRSHGKKKKIETEVFIRKASNFDQKLAELTELLEREDIRKYMMHSSFDFHAIRQLICQNTGHEPKIKGLVIDVQAGAHVLEENVFAMANLNLIQGLLTDFSVQYDNAFSLKYDKSDMLIVPKKELLPYACADADVTYRAARTIGKKLLAKHSRRMANYLIKFVNPTLHSLYVLEKNGVPIDLEVLPEVKENLLALISENEKMALKQVPTKVKEKKEHVDKLSLTRRDLTRDALFTKSGFGLKPIKLTQKSKQPSVDKESLQLLAGYRIPKKAQDFLTYYAEFQEQHMLYTRTIKSFEKFLKPDERIHPNLSLVASVTGRVGCRNPNLMGVPKRSKSAGQVRKVIAARPGYVLLAPDQSQSELRWCAHVANDRSMIDIFKNSRLDIHTETGKELSGPSYNSLDERGKKMARQNAKPVNFGLIFKMSAPGLVRYAKLEYGLDLSNNQAQQWMNIFFNKYRGVLTYHRSIVEFARRHGYVETPLGRRRRLPEIHSKNAGLRNEAERQAINTPIQGASSDTVLIALNELLRKGDLNPEEIIPILFIHDELVFEVKEDADIPMYATIIRNEMEHPPLFKDYGIELKVPLLAEPKIGYNLSEMKPLTI